MTAIDKAKRKTKTGTVVSNKMQNTVIVKVDRTMKHPRYGKVVKRARKYYAHIDNDLLQIGDTVTIMETRPLSKLKRWRVMEKLK